MAHSSENRAVDCIPYDTTRVQISSSDASSTYINASHVMEITQRIPTAFIITQMPLPDKLNVFWTMIWEQESEVVACLASDAQVRTRKVTYTCVTIEKNEAKRALFEIFVTCAICFYRGKTKFFELRVNCKRKTSLQLNGELYWPISEESNLDVGNFTISLKKTVNHTTYVQRILAVHHDKKKSEKVVVHMQFLVWPSK